MKLPIYVRKIEVVQLPLVEECVKTDDGRVFSFMTTRGFEIYADDVLIAHCDEIAVVPREER